MALEKFGIEGGLQHYLEDGVETVCRIFAAGAPAGTSGETDAAAIGSVYSNLTNGDTYRKIADTSSASDWELIAGQADVDALKCDTSANAITTVTTLDSFLVDEYAGGEWLLVLSLDSAPEQKIYMNIQAMHDGETGGDATAVKYSISNKKRHGANFDHDVDVDVSGAAGAQIMELKITAAAAVSARARCHMILSDI